MTDQTCIRRWYSTWTSCKCPPCQRTNRRLRLARELGHEIPRVPSNAAWIVLDRMLAADWSNTAIASACGMPVASIHTITYQAGRGYRRRFTAKTAARIVAAGEPTAGYVGATGTRRKLQALARMGHTNQTISRACMANGFFVSDVSVGKIQRGMSRHIQPSTAAAVDRAWRDLTRTPGASPATARRAERNGWPGVAAWDNIDDPTEQPQGVAEAAA